MSIDRRHVLAGLAVLLTVATVVILWDVLATVFFAITVGYVLAPVSRWFRARGLRPWWASAATSVVAIVGTLVVLVPVGVLLVVRFGAVLELLREIPDDRVVVEAFGFSYALSATDLVPAATDLLTGLAVGVARAAPVLAIKFTLFAVVVFALLMAGQRARAAIVGVVPEEYRDVFEALGDRARTTLTAIYVVQAGTAVATFLIGIPVFVLLGYEFPFTLAALSAVLQFLPVVGPSVVIGGLALAELLADQLVRAVLVVLVGGVLVAWLPDPVVRPRLARRAGRFPGSLYFIGFTGGLFSLGVVGIIAGPLVVALLVEATGLLAAELADGESTDASVPGWGSSSSLPLVWIPVPFADSDEAPGDSDPSERRDTPDQTGDGEPGGR